MLRRIDLTIGPSGRAKLGYGPEDGEEGTTWPLLPEIAPGNLRNWNQGVELGSRAWFWLGSRGEQGRLPAGFSEQLEGGGGATRVIFNIIQSTERGFPSREKKDYDVGNTDTSKFQGDARNLGGGSWKW